MKVSSITRSGFTALAFAACAAIAHASPLPGHYHVAPVQFETRDTFLYAVNANGVAAGYQGSTSHGVVWQDDAPRVLSCQGDNAPYSDAFAINDAMQVAGSCYLNGANYAVVWDAAGNPTKVPNDTVQPQAATGINNLGHVVGDAGGVAYVWKGGKVKLLGTLGGTTSNAMAINDKGWIVGGSQTAGNATTQAFVYRNGQMENLNWGGDYATASAVNDRGHIVGWRYTGSSFAEHAILDDGVSVTDLGRHSDARGINHLDQVVGSWSGHGFIYTHGRMYDLNTLLESTTPTGWNIVIAYAINDSGVIVGWGTFNGAYQPVVLTPTP